MAMDAGWPALAEPCRSPDLSSRLVETILEVKAVMCALAEQSAESF